MWHNAHKGTFNGNGMSRQPSTQFYLFRKSKSHANEQWTLYVTCFQPNSELQLQGMTIWTSWAAVRELIQHLWIDRQARRVWIFFSRLLPVVQSNIRRRVMGLNNESCETLRHHRWNGATHWPKLGPMQKGAARRNNHQPYARRNNQGVSRSVAW